MRRYQITIGDKAFEIEIVSLRGDQARVLVNGRPYEVKFQPVVSGGAVPAAAPAPRPAKPAAPAAPTGPAPRAAPPPPPPKPVPGAQLGVVVAPMPGSVLDVLVKVGDQVKAGDTVAKLEAMKMENDIRVPISGVVGEVRVSKGDSVAVSEVLLVVSEG
jgi:biotin carboxyl carrier protein